MQTASDKEPEAIVTCPYNPAHRLPLFRMKRHLVKCKLNSPNNVNDIMVTCPLNNEHRIPQPEFAFHMNVCPNRIDLDRKCQIPEVIDRVADIEVPIINTPNDECWDDEANPTYDPTKHVTELPILRVRNCDSKARRKEFRMEERNRIARINEETQHLAKGNGQAQGRHVAASTSSATSFPGRRPFTQSAAIANKPNLDPYKVNDMLQALNEDQKNLLDTLQNMGENETMAVFPIEETGQSEPFTVDDFPSLSRGWNTNGAVRSVGRGGYAASLQGGRGRGRVDKN